MRYKRTAYPDLNKIEKNFIDKLEEKYSENIGEMCFPALTTEMFLQTWSNTACGLDEGGMSGQAFTNAYTVVCIMKWANRNDNEGHSAVGVYFKGKFAYFLSDPCDLFYSDLKSHMLVSRREAWLRYKK